MLSLKKKMLMSGSRPIRPQDVFATSLYTGNATPRTIYNGLDLAGKGGLVWAKSRTDVGDHGLYDTVRGPDLHLSSQATDAEQYRGSNIEGFGSDSFSLGRNATYNGPSSSYVAWAFRRAKKFFDIITYTGNGQSGRQIPHGLGDVPGMIVVKARSAASNWTVRHRSATGNLYLDLTKAQEASFNHITAMDAGTFTVSSADNVNTNGVQYVAYLFAHNPDLIDCGSYVGNGNANGPSVTCGKGWNPQFLLIKNTAASASYSYWMMLDTARTPGLSGADEILRANTSESQLTIINVAELTGTGFKLSTTAPDVNQSNSTYIYLAIRAPT